MNVLAEILEVAAVWLKGSGAVDKDSDISQNKKSSILNKTEDTKVSNVVIENHTGKQKTNEITSKKLGTMQFEMSD